MTSVFLVIGEAGQYSDHAKWIVCAYTGRDEARAHAVLATSCAQAIDPFEGHNEYDPDRPANFDPAHYRVKEIPLREKMEKRNG